MKKGGDLLLQVTHTGLRGSSTQPANIAKVKKKILHVDLVNPCLELALIQAAGEDGVDDLHHNIHGDGVFPLCGSHRHKV